MLRFGVFLWVMCAATMASCAGAAGERVPLDLSGQRPEVRFQISGQAAAQAIFDTGAGGNVLDRAFAVSAGLPNEQPVRVGSGGGGEPVEGFLTTIPELAIGNIVLHNVKAVVLDLPKPSGNEAMVAVFGPGMFAGNFVTLDFSGEALVLHKKGADFTPAGAENSYTEGPRPLPAIPVNIGGVSYAAHMDTGAPRTLTLPIEMAKDVLLSGELEDAGVVRLVTGERKIYRGRIKGLVEVGPLLLENPEVEFLEGARSINVGMALLRRLSIALDPEEGRVWIASEETGEN